MAVIKWEPFDNLDKLFEDFVVDFSPKIFKHGVGWDLAVDVYEKGNNLIAEMNLPGIDPDKVNVSVEDNNLIISGSREEEVEEKNEKRHYYSKEIKRGSFERVLSLPVNVKADKITAEYKDGVLRIIMPKESKTKAKKIKIQKK